MRYFNCMALNYLLHLFIFIYLYTQRLSTST
jgi:hypothetical protein